MFIVEFISPGINSSILYPKFAQKRRQKFSVDCELSDLCPVLSLVMTASVRLLIIASPATLLINSYFSLTEKLTGQATSVCLPLHAKNTYMLIIPQHHSISILSQTRLDFSSSFILFYMFFYY